MKKLQTGNNMDKRRKKTVFNGLPQHHPYLSEQQQVISKTGVKSRSEK